MLLPLIITYLLLKVGAGEAIQACRVAYAPSSRLSVDEFLESSCCMCHHYLFEHTPSLSSARCVVGSHEPGSRAVLEVGNRSASASHRSADTVDLMCRVAFKGDEASCHRWRACCDAAADCCRGGDMTAAPPGGVGGGADLASAALPSCPATWDGWHCWPPAAAGSRSLAPCPSFLYPGYDCDEDRRYVSRECTPGGRWLTDNGTLQEPSDYEECSRPVHCIDGILRLSWRLTCCCQAASLLALCSALLVYLYFRNLRTQPRIQIHINLCAAMVFYGVISISYTAVVKRRSADLENGNSVISLNTVLCRLLNALDKFALLSVYLSMFLEGLYLHWLLVNSFQQPRLRVLIGPTWGFAILATAVYSITKTVIANEVCWVSQVEVVEWVCYAPSIAAVVLNLTFLANIQRILWRQLQAHKEEPSSYRRAVKAALLLVPPFGLAMLFLLYHPSTDSFQTRSIYECFSAVIMNLQGFFVVLVLCFCNAEVRSTVRGAWRRHWRPRAPHSSSRDCSLSNANTIGYSHKSAANGCSIDAVAAAAEPAEHGGGGDAAAISGGSDRTGKPPTDCARGAESSLLLSVVRD